MNVISPKNCAVLEQTGDGVTCGRCHFYVGDNDVCPRHGDVAAVMTRYRETGKLTLERDHKAAQSLLGTKT